MEFPIGTGSIPLRTVVDRTIAPYLWRPWYDGVLTSAVSKVYFPLSRAWAAAVQAKGDIHAFNDVMGDRLTVGGRILDTLYRAEAAYHDAMHGWEMDFFGDTSVTKRTLPGVERRRTVAARKFMALRAAFLPGHLERPFPAVDFNIEEEGAVAERHGARLKDPAAGMAIDVTVPVRESRQVIQDQSACFWVRFETPSGCDAPGMEARVREPLTGKPVATLIFAHGIGMEPEMWGEKGTIADWFLDQGYRVIEPQGPWHARRRPDGYYGGEAILARGPGGLLDYSWTHVRELGRLIVYARERDVGQGQPPRPVLNAGISLGALTTMQLLTWARYWPEEQRPDYGLLIAPAASLVEVAYRGSLTGSMGVSEALIENGWPEDRVARWAPLLNAGEVPGIDPSRIVTVLGDVDEVTPFASGEALARAWQLPPENIWTRNQGHFSVSLGLTSAPDPLQWMVSRIQQG